MPEAQQDKMANADPLVGVAETLSEDAPRTAEEHRKAINDEYGEFVAIAAITHDGARAYNIGDAVPRENVERWDYLGLGLVARRTTKAAAAATGSSSAGGGVEPAKS